MIRLHPRYLPPPPEERGEPWTRCLVLEPGLPALPSAIAVLEPLQSGEAKCKHALRHLERFPPGTPYPTLGERMVQLLQTPALDGRTFVLVDRTGVGKAVYRMLLDCLHNRATCRIGPVTVTAGPTPTPTGLSVQRRELAGHLQAVLQTRRLKAPPDLPLFDLLVREMENFEVKPSPVPLDDLSAWRQGAQDDLVLAVGLACWLCEEVQRRHGCWR
jgi:hypothetical protein